jgi:hypothetical protein
MTNKYSMILSISTAAVGIIFWHVSVKYMMTGELTCIDKMKRAFLVLTHDLTCPCRRMGPGGRCR